MPPIETLPENVAPVATKFLIVTSSEFVKTTSPVLPNTEVTRFIPPLAALPEILYVLPELLFHFREQKQMLKCFL